MVLLAVSNGGLATARLDLAPELEGLDDRRLVRVVQVAADRHPVGDACDLGSQWLQAVGDIHGGRIALDRGVRGKDDLLHGWVTVGHPLFQVLEVQLVHAHAIERRDDALQDVVDALELAGLLHRDQVARLGHDAQAGVVPARVGADVA